MPWTSCIRRSSSRKPSCSNVSNTPHRRKSGTSTADVCMSSLLTIWSGTAMPTMCTATPRATQGGHLPGRPHVPPGTVRERLLPKTGGL